MFMEDKRASQDGKRLAVSQEWCRMVYESTFPHRVSEITCQSWEQQFMGQSPEFVGFSLVFRDNQKNLLRVHDFRIFLRFNEITLLKWGVKYTSLRVYTQCWVDTGKHHKVSLHSPMHISSPWNAVS